MYVYYVFEATDVFGFVDTLDIPATSYDEAYDEVVSFGVYEHINFVGMRGF